MSPNQILEHKSIMLRLDRGRDWVEIYDIKSRVAVINDYSADLPDCGGVPLKENLKYQGDSAGLENSKPLELPVSVLNENTDIEIKSVISSLSPQYSWFQMGTLKEQKNPKYQYRYCNIDHSYIDIYVTMI